MEWINIYGLLFVIAILIPNILYAVTCKDGFENKYHNKLIEVLEQLGRFGCMGFMVVSIPTLHNEHWFNEMKAVYLILGAVIAVLYWLGWGVSWKENSVRKALLLSILPSILFLECGILTLNIPLIILAVVFAIGHITLSYKNAVL